MIQNTFRVVWRLLESCNYSCAYCPGSRHDDNCVIMPERLRRICWRILQYPASEYQLTISGGEPALHPFLPDIIDYFQQSGRNVHLTLETNGIAGVEYFRQLLRPGFNLALALGIHPGQTPMEQIPQLVTGLHQTGALTCVNFFTAGGKSPEPEILQMLRILLREFPFNLNIVEIDKASRDGFPIMPDSEECGTEPVALEFLPAQAGLSGNSTQDNAIAKPDTRWCVRGVNTLFINPAGQFRYANCPMALWGRPLWELERNAAPDICQCHLRRCPPGNCSLPRFATRQEAENWLKETECQGAVLALQLPVLLPPGQTAPGVTDLVRIGLQRLAPESKSPGERKPGKIVQEPLFFQRYQDKIARIFPLLADRPSRELFLRLIKIIITGDAAYLPVPNPGRSVAPASAPQKRFTGRPGHYCQKLELREITTAASLAPHRGTIRQHHPELRLTLSARADRLIDVLSMILDLSPEYQIFLEYGEGLQVKCRAITPRTAGEGAGDGAEVQHLSNFRPDIAIIIMAANNGGTISRALDGALVQDSGNIEIIVADNGSTDATGSIVRQYAELYPGLIQYQRHETPRDPGLVANAALAAVHADYIVFSDASGMLAEDFVLRTREVIASEEADIVVTDTVICHKDRPEEIWGVVSGYFVGEESLAIFLSEDGGGYTPFGKLFRASFLRSENVHFGSGSYGGVSFCIQAFFYARKVVIVPWPGYYQYSACPVAHDSGSCSVFKDFCLFVDFVAGFLEDQSLPAGFAKHCLTRIYEQVRWPLLEEVATATASSGQDRESVDLCNSERKQPVAGLLTGSLLARLGRSRDLLHLLFRDYATLLCHIRHLTPRVRPEDLDWRAAASSLRLHKNCSAYANADESTTSPPLLSVIMPNYNSSGYLEACLNSILNQSMSDYELIIVDDASSDDSFDTLANYAACHPRIRLYRMEQNCRQGVCRNIGIEKARGKYLLFVDADDIVEPGFFAHALKVIQESDAELALFSLRKVENGRQTWASIVPQGIFGQKQFLHMYASGKFSPAPYAKIFRTDFVRLSGASFEEGIYHQDQFFIGRIALKAQRVASDPFMAYNVISSVNSTMRPSSRRYLHVHSACRFYAFLNDVAAKFPAAGWNQHLVWNLETVLLPALRAFLDGGSDLPLSTDDYSNLQNNALFLRGLLSGFARLATRHRAAMDILPAAGARPRTPYKYAAVAAPLVSVILAVYNQEAVVGRAIESILGQSLRSLELIIVDDASTDHTADIIDAYARRDGRIRILRNSRNSGGCGQPRNTGILASSAPFFTFVDSD